MPDLFSRCLAQTRDLSVILYEILRTRLKDGSSIVNTLLQKLVKCVEIRRKFRKLQNKFCWLRGEKYYSFCYTYMAWFLIFWPCKIGMWKTWICHNSKYINPLCPIFGYVVYHIMTRFCAKNCTKLWSKSFYINCFPFVQNLPRWYL
jgi:hypothetical protein